MKAPARAIRPIANTAFILRGVDELESHSTCIGSGRPRGDGFIMHCADDLVLIGSGPGLDEREFFAIRIEISTKLTEHRNGPTVGGGKDHRVLHNDESLATGND